MDFRTAFDPKRALGVALRLIRRAPVTLLLGGTLLFLTNGGRPTFEIQTSGPMPPLREYLRLLWQSGLFWLGGGACLWALVLFVANSYLRIGYVGAVQRVLVTGEERTGDLFQGRGLLGSMLLARIGRWLASVAAGLPFGLLAAGSMALGRTLGLEPLGFAGAVVVGGIGAVASVYVLLGLLLVDEAVAIESLDAGAAFQRAWSLAEGNRLTLLLYAIVLTIVRLAGGLACIMTCGLGWILLPLATSWVEVAWAESYLRFALPEPDEGAWVDRVEMV